MASSGKIYSNKAAGSFVADGTTYTFSDAQWYVDWSQTKNSAGKSTVTFTVWTTKTNSSPRILDAGGKITFTATAGAIRSPVTGGLMASYTLVFDKTGRYFAKSGGNNYIQQTLEDDGEATFSFQVDHTAAGDAAFKVDFSMDCAGYTAGGTSSVTLDSNPVEYTLTLVKGSNVLSFTGGGKYAYDTVAESSATAYRGYALTKYTGTLYNGSGTSEWPLSGTSRTDDNTWTMQADRTITVHAAPATYTMTFDANGGSVSTSTKSVTFGEVATDLPIPTREGYDFKGWSASFDSAAQTWLCLGRDHMYTDKFSVHLEAYSTDWSVYNTRMISCTDNGGWNIEPYDGDRIAFIAYDSGVGYKYAVSDATWASLGSNSWHSFDLIFDGLTLRGYVDGTCIATSPTFSSSRVSYSATNVIVLGAEASNNQEVADGHHFNGQIRNVVIRHDTALITEEAAKCSFVVPANDITLSATWELKKYILNFDANGGSSTPASITKLHDVAVTLPDAIDRADAVKQVTTTFNANGGAVDVAYSTSHAYVALEFIAWKAGSDGSQYSAGSSYTANRSTTLSAIWQAVGEYVGSPITLPIPTRAGYAFAGWYTAITGGTRITDYSPIRDSVLYAHWTADYHTVTIKDPYRDDIITEYNVTFGETIELPALSSIDNYYEARSELGYFDIDGITTVYGTIYSEFLPYEFYDDATGIPIETTTYTLDVDHSVVICLQYTYSTDIFEFVVPDAASLDAPSAFETVDYIVKTNDAPAVMPEKITPTSLVRVPFSLGEDVDSFYFGTYRPVYRQEVGFRAWVKVDDKYVPCTLLVKADGTFYRADGCLVKNSDTWLNLNEIGG